MWEDPIVLKVRQIREELAAGFNYDVAAIFADLRKRQTTLGPRLIRPAKGRKAEQAVTPDQDSNALHPGR